MSEKYLTDTEEYIYEHRVSTNWFMEDSHFHDGFEIFLSLSDGLQFFVNNKVYPINRGDLMIFNSMDLHRTMIPADLQYERIYLIFNPVYVRSLSTEHTDLLSCFLKAGRRDSIHLSPAQLKTVLALFADCEAGLTTTETFGADLLKKMALARLLIFVNSCFSSESEPIHSLKSRNSDWARNLQKYIASHLDEDLTLDALAAEFYISKRHMESVFKEYCGFSVGEYIISMRIIKARELLRQGMRVTEAGEAVGYRNTSHFCRIFKQHTGVSPKKYAFGQG